MKCVLSVVRYTVYKKVYGIIIMGLTNSLETLMPKVP